MSSPESPIDIPVVIIGGGGVGMCASSFLSDEGIEHILFEKHKSTSPHLKAHYINQRTMEIFRKHNMAKEILEIACPVENMCRVEWKTSLGGDGPYDRRLLSAMTGGGGAENTAAANTYKKDSSMDATNLPLLRLEPLLLKFAKERNPGRVLFEHAVEDFQEINDRVLVTVRTPEGNKLYYRAQYVVAADAGKLSGSKLGINMEGPAGLVDFVSTHFKADLSEYWDDRTLITHFINPEGESMANLDCGALLQMGPTWGRHSEEWVLTFGFAVNDEKRWDQEALPARIRQLLKLPDLEMEVLHITNWVLSRQVADKYRVGRTFIAGDAAHRRPPTSGLGLNTGIEDAQNIAWKLGMVLNNKADASLLDSYEAERRPIGIRNSDWAFFTFGNMQVLTAGMGLIPGAKEYNMMRFMRIFEDSEFGRTAMHHIRRIFATQDVEYSAHDIELGFKYEGGATVPDGTEAPLADPQGQTYTPTTRPGHRLPHAWVEQDRKRVSTHDLIGNSDFLVITDEEGGAWAEAARRISKLTSLKVRTAQIKAKPHTRPAGLCIDLLDDWSQVRGIKTGGAILVRPDNFVAWRTQSASDAVSAEQELRAALAAVTGKPLPGTVPVLNGNGELPYTNGHTNGYTNGYTNGHTNGLTNGHTNGHVENGGVMTGC